MIKLSTTIRFLLAVLTLLLGVVGGAAFQSYSEQISNKRAIKERLDGHPPHRSVFLRDNQECNPPSADQIQLDRAMLEVARASAVTEPPWDSPALQYVVSYFAWHWRLTGDARQPRCAPTDETFAALGSLMVEASWPNGNTELNDLRLIERLPPMEERAARLARIAFLNWIPPSDVGGEDSRPYARELLAEQGAFALPWLDEALRSIDGDTRLGTSAAYLAVALAPEQGLPMVEKAMAEMLEESHTRLIRAHSDGGRVAAIRSNDANRLIELGYALARGGHQAQSYSAPVIAMLDEVIARAVPPFGLSATAPTEFCRIARHIGGRAADAANAKPFCASTYTGGDGAPRPY